MDARQIVLNSFVLLQPRWSVEKGRQFIDALEPSHIIVLEHDPQDRYDLFSVEETLELFAHASSDTPLAEALRLQKRPATPIVEGDTRAELVPDQCVVIEDGHLIGFFDANVPPQSIAIRGNRPTDQPLEQGGSEMRAVVAEYSEQVALQTVFSVLISLSASLTPQKGVALPIALPLGAKVDIVVQARRNLVLEAGGEGTLVITSEEETLPLQFKLRAVDLGPGQLRVLAFYQGQSLGALTLRVDVLEKAPLSPTPRYSQQLLEYKQREQPDLSLFILEHTENGKPALTFRLTAQDPTLGLNLKPFGPILLKSSALHYFQEFFKDIETLPVQSQTDQAEAEEHLAAKGMQMFSKLLPPDLQQHIWSLRRRIQSVLVQSEEPWIPWELCKLYGQENGHIVEGPFLCEAFTMTRWIPGIAMKPDLTLKNLAIVVPADSGLPHARAERNYLLSLANEKRQVTSISARSLELRKALASGQYDGWHFTGHGAFRHTDPNRSVMYLEELKKFTPEDLNGVVRNLGLARPLVFLNACQMGQNAVSLTGIGGWASQFLDAGAGAFIGAYWSVYDKSAHDFAKELYNRLLSGMPIGKAVQQARMAIKPLGNPTWLAYTVFADPLATVSG